MAIRILALVLVLPLAACGLFPKEKSKDGSDSPDDHAGDDQGQGGEDQGGEGDAQGEKPRIDIDQYLVVREPGATESDAAALFLLKAKQGVLEVKNVKGPAFLGNAAVGRLDDETAKKLFSELSSPLPAEKTADLLENFRDATVVYFKNYSGRLCDGGTYRLEITTSIQGVTPLSAFDFVGARGESGHCSYSTLALTTTYSETK